MRDHHTPNYVCTSCGRAKYRRPLLLQGRKELFCSIECRLEWNSPERRFWRKADQSSPDDCWTWMAQRDRDGYGLFWFQNTNMRATHVAWFLTHGRWPKHQMCHRCDNPSCVNPEHLYDGTQSENINEAYTKDRALRGDRHPDAILTTQDVIDIRARVAAGEARRLIADEFGINVSTISHIVTRRNWKHV